MTTFTVAAANTWQFVNVPVTLDNSGTWQFTTGLGLQVFIASLAGSTYQPPSLNTWNTGAYYAAAGATNYMATVNAQIYLTQFSITEGPLGLGATGFVRSGDTISDELRNCQRYCQLAGIGAVGAYGGTATDIAYKYTVAMRTGPTIGFTVGNSSVGYNVFGVTSGTQSSINSIGGSSTGIIIRGSGSGGSGNQPIGVNSDYLYFDADF